MKGITVRMTTSLMITYLGTYPIFEDTKENKQDAIDLCYDVLNISTNTKDESQQLGMIAVVYLVAGIMGLKEILNTLILKELLHPKHGLEKSFPPEAQQLVREMARMDYVGYIDWISPFLSKAGVIDINSELEDLDAIQDAIRGQSNDV